MPENKVRTMVHAPIRSLNHPLVSSLDSEALWAFFYLRVHTVPVIMVILRFLYRKVRKDDRKGDARVCILQPHQTGKDRTVKIAMIAYIEGIYPLGNKVFYCALQHIFIQPIAIAVPEKCTCRHKKPPPLPIYGLF